jgi:topoisomerase-4 subunit A
LVTKYPARTVKKLSAGVSTLGARVLYFDEPSGVVSTHKRGECLGEFEATHKLLVVRRTGVSRVFEITDPLLVGTDILHIGRHDPETIYSAVYFEGGAYAHFLKRFSLEGAPQTTEFSIIGDHAESELLAFFDNSDPQCVIEYQGNTGKDIKKETIDLTVAADVRSYKALGNRFTAKKVKKVTKIAPPPPVDEPSPKVGKGTGLELDLFE